MSTPASHMPSTMGSYVCGHQLSLFGSYVDFRANPINQSCLPILKTITENTVIKRDFM